MKYVCSHVICLPLIFLVTLNINGISSASLVQQNVFDSARTMEPQSNISTRNEVGVSYTDLPPQCDSQVYCYGNLLHTVQLASIYADSKTFVDMKMLVSEEETLKNFESFMATHNQNPTRDQVKQWVESNFAARGNEFVDWIPDDWVKEPKFLDKIKDSALKEWARDLNNFWIKLGRKMKQDVYDNEKLYSIIPVPNPVMVPGGRFLEIYYWDSYWIIRGLLHCEMFKTVKGILQNLRSFIQRFNHIPNGGRVYYLGRSHPPLLANMIKSYYDFTKDQEFVLNSLADLQTEFEFFMERHLVEVNGVQLFRYIDNSFGPRPESYREDYEKGAIFQTDEEKEDFYSEMKAGAESGMDFTARWFITANGSWKGNLTDSKARSVIPVELNAYMYKNAMLLAEWFGWAGDQVQVEYYRQKASELLNAINKVLWHEDIGSWLDYDLINNRRRELFSASNLAPLWVKAFNPADEAKITLKILNYLKVVGVNDYPGGVPNTLEHTGEQWDFPNVWAPLQHLIIIGMDNLSHPDAKALAYNWTEKWVRNNYLTYKDTRAMFEKYSAIEIGGQGGGGEYEVQLGFGWSNGAILDLLDKYGDRLTAIDHSDNEVTNNASNLSSFKINALFSMSSAFVLLTMMMIMI
ncbi:trehalase-like [Culicoides brevitarsis]|uniref:trehalase-like n=1 Tax=Culicoides brevitarsis TaxID=469753 RepID=UPI00307C119A